MGNCPVGDGLTPLHPSLGAFLLSQAAGWDRGRASRPRLGAVPQRAGWELLGLLARAGRARSC